MPDYPATVIFTSANVKTTTVDSIKEFQSTKTFVYGSLTSIASSIRNMATTKTVLGSIEYIYPERPTTGQIFPRGLTT